MLQPLEVSLMAVTSEDIRQGIKELGLSGQSLCVHASLRSLGRVDGGPNAVIDAVLAEDCTMLVPTFSHGYDVPPPTGWRLERNGVDAGHPWLTAGVGRTYTPDSIEIDIEDMGAIPAKMLERPDRIRGNHPTCSFAAVGPQARELIGVQEPLDMLAPLRALVEAGGSVALMGVGFNRMTLLHLAEKQAGRNLFRRWANGPDGQPMEIEVSGCSVGFEKFVPVLAPLVKRTWVGQSRWMALPAAQTLSLAVDAIRKDPKITTCGRSDCLRCRDALLGGPG